jgi:hypothetical protein
VSARHKRKRHSTGKLAYLNTKLSFKRKFGPWLKLRLIKIKDAPRDGRRP